MQSQSNQFGGNLTNKIDLKQQILFASSPVIFTTIFILLLAKFTGLFAVGVLVLGNLCVMPLFVKSFLRIKKFRKMLLVVVPLLGLLLGVYIPFTYTYSMPLYPTKETTMISTVAVLFIIVLVTVPTYLIIRWTNQWNRQFENDVSD